MRGVQFGRPKRNLPDNFEQVCYQWKSGEILGRRLPGLQYAVVDVLWEGEGS